MPFAEDGSILLTVDGDDDSEIDEPDELSEEGGLLPLAP
jgi:hypothetical protein